jgi:formylglycine-generating enzyme required for sulfatase activity
MVLVYVPAGEFEMGSTDEQVDEALQICNEVWGDCKREWFEDELPAHTVSLKAFWIDRTEVSNAQYRECVEAGACWAPMRCTWGDPTYDDASKADHPVVCVDWYRAQTYCEWAGGRLPTEAEWEYAARGPETPIYPWGDEFDCSRGNFDDETEYDDYVLPGGAGCDGYVETAPVGSFSSGVSWCGALDLAGNVWEWCADWYDPDYYAGSLSRDPQGPNSGEYRVPRGGSWFGNRRDVRSVVRYGLTPGHTYSHVGFRCVVPARGDP